LTDGLEDGDGNHDDEIHEINEDSDDGIGKGDEKEGDDDIGKSILDRHDGFRVNFLPEHDEKSNDNHKKCEQEVCNVSEDFPNWEKN